MIKMPFDEIIGKIKEKSGVSDAEINSKIDKKLEQLSGLISKEGAAHIIANEMGIKLFDQVSGRLQIKNILPGMRDVETVGKVLQVFEVREFMRQESVGKVGSFIIGDETGTIRVVCWGDKTEAIGELKPDSIVKIVSGYIKENNGRKEIHLNDRSKLIMNPPDEKVGEVAAAAAETASAARKKISELKEDDSNVELLGTIVQVFEPRFFEVCPQCGGRAAPRDGKFYCKRHDAVEPAYSSVFNVFLDDGTDNVRVVFFRNQAEKLVGKSAQEMLVYKDAPEKFEEVKNALLGNIIKVTGRVKKNEMFQRIDFVTNEVDPNPDPGKEIERLKNENAVQQ
jgi:replication factor A1